MSWSERFAKFDRLQQSLLFKCIASGAIVLVAIGAIIWYSVQQKAVADNSFEVKIVEVDPEADKNASGSDTGTTRGEANKVKVETPELKREREYMQTVADLANYLRTQRISVGSFSTGVAVCTGIALAAVWIGLGLTYLVLLGFGGLFVVPMVYMPEIHTGLFKTASWFTRESANSISQTGKFAAGVLALALTFATLVRGLAIVLSPAHPVLAIARNVVNEAVRMKVSLVFIIVLIIGLAALPGMLQENTPLRYRVQNFLQYGMGGAYTLTAILVLFLSAATLAIEQRDKVIWQTMTKPVAAWQYILGKWLGVITVAAVLLAVSSTGVFLFTQYLRNQRAGGEVQPFVADTQNPTQFSEDRFVLEYQVLSGRETINPTLSMDVQNSIDAEVGARLKKADDARKENPKAEVPEVARVYKEVAQEKLKDFLSIAPNDFEGKPYVFTQMQAAKKLGMPMACRYKINAGNNDPSDQYKVTFLIGEGSAGRVRTETTNLGQAMTFPVYPMDINDDGELHLRVYNGDVLNRRPNPQTIQFTIGDGLQISHPVVSFATNFMHAVLVLWFKLVFLSIIAITCATFLSFSVSCLVAFAVFAIAETAKVLAKSVESFSTTDNNNQSIWYKEVISQVAENIAWSFKTYADLAPTSALVEGKYLPGSQVFVVGVFLLGISAVLFALGSFIFRQRELATYSGQ